jgi:hypothetical protein
MRIFWLISPLIASERGLEWLQRSPNVADRIKIIVDEREFDTILAALRAYQTLLRQNSAILQDVEEIAENSGDLPLDVAEVDDLCERLNCDSLALSRRVAS